jgi:hypothetical protein
VDKLQLTGQNLAEFSTLEVALCHQRIYGVISQTALLKVENSAQTTSRFSPVEITLLGKLNYLLLIPRKFFHASQSTICEKA